MATLTLPPAQQPAPVTRASRARVYVDGQRRRDLVVLSWELSQAPEFGRVLLAAAASGIARAGGPIGTTIALPAVGTEVLIRSDCEPTDAEFRGRVRSHGFQIDGDDTDAPTALVEHYLTGALGSTISSRWQAQDNEAVEIPNSPAVFNSGDANLASDKTISIGTRRARLFAAGDSAVRWSVADALGYVLATEAPSDIDVPAQAELDRLAGDVDLPAMNITGTSALDAMVKIAHRGGLAIRAARTGLGLVAYRPGAVGHVRNVRLQPAGAKLAVDKTNLWQGSVRFSRRPSLRGVLALGQRKQYESTFALSKGWDPALADPRWRDFVRSLSDDWPGLSDVYRKWVLNEHGRYSQPPWNLATYDLSSIDDDDFLVHAPRSFLPCLSSDAFGTSLGVVVEFRLAAGGPWWRWTGPMFSASDECTIYLGGDALPAELFQAAVDDTLTVRVTATVVSDVKVSAEVTGDQDNVRQIIDLSDRAAWRKVHSASIFYQLPGLAGPTERDDTSMLRGVAGSLAQIASTGTEAEFVLGSVDTSYCVGDIVEQIDGRQFELASGAHARPTVTSIKHELGTKQTTTLIVGG